MRDADELDGSAHRPAPAWSPWSEPRARWEAVRRRLTDQPVLAGSAAAVLAVVAIAAVVLVWAGRMPTPAQSAEQRLPRLDTIVDPDDASPATAPVVFVHAAGAVERPGLYRLPAGSRVADLLAAAGGPRRDADPDRLNLAALVADGERIRVPAVGEGNVADEDVGSGDGGDDPRVDLNAADASRLDSLPGIGPALADAIVRDRDANGRFASVDDLQRVPGIGPATVARLADLARV